MPEPTKQSTRAVLGVVLVAAIVGGGIGIWAWWTASERAERGEVRTWIPINGGTFEMGSNTYLQGQQPPYAKTVPPPHTVSVPAFEMLQSEVTLLQYEACVYAGACSEPDTRDEEEECNWGHSDRYNHPINCVDWHQAKAYCEWAGARLPSEAEWEYAARSGGKDTGYPWGNEVASCTTAVIAEDGKKGCGTGRTSAVCSKPAGNTDQGLCDMSGNVGEWVEDRAHLYFAHPNFGTAPTDGSAWTTKDGAHVVAHSEHITRGGSWGTEVPEYALAAYRIASMSTDNHSGHGFRCARPEP